MKRLTKRTIWRRTAGCSRAWRTSRCTNLRGFPRLHDAWEFEGPSSGDTRVFEPDRSEPINRFATGISSGRFVPATDLATMCGVAVELDDQTVLLFESLASELGRTSWGGSYAVLALPSSHLEDRTPRHPVVPKRSKTCSRRRRIFGSGSLGPAARRCRAISSNTSLGRSRRPRRPCRTAGNLPLRAIG
jgi:hypothetical protein